MLLDIAPLGAFKLFSAIDVPAEVFLMIFGLILLIKGGDWFVDASVGIAKKFGLPELLIGATVVSIGTTLPEVLTSVFAAIGNNGGIAYGNAIGSIICNTALICAITIAIKPGKADRKVLIFPVEAFFTVAVFYALNAYAFGGFARWAGIVLLLKIAGKNKGKGLVIGVILMTIGLFVLSTTTNIKGVLIGIAPTVIGYIVLGILFNASVKDFIPAGKAGLFQGIRMIFFVLIPMVLGPAIGDIACRSSMITYINEYGVETIVPAKSMFLYAAIVSVLTLVPLYFLIKKGFKVEEE